MGSTKTLQQPSGEQTVTTALISNENKPETNNTETKSETSNSNQSSIPNSPKSSPLRRSNTFSSPRGSPSHKAAANHKCRHKCKSDNVSPENISTENNTTKQPTMIRRHSNVSNITLTNVSIELKKWVEKSSFCWACYGQKHFMLRSFNFFCF